MSSLQILRPVTIKARVTERLKQRLAAEVQAAIRQVEEEIQQLDLQVKRAQLTANLTPQQQLQLRQVVEAEKQKRQAEKQELQERLRQIADLPLGSEVVQGTVQAVAQVSVGDDWDALFATEILVEDGRVVAIREG